MPPERLTALLTVLLGTMLAMPVALFEHAPLIDWPNHLARHHLVLATPASEVLQQLYAVDWHWIPNLGVDLAVLPLQPWIGASAATRAVLVLSIMGWVVAPVVLHRAAFGEWSPWPLGSALFAYNAMLYWGFENAYATAPLVLLALALVISLDERRLQLGALFVSGVVLFTAHLVMWGAYGLCVACWMAAGQTERRWRDLLWAGVALSPGAVAFVVGQLVAPATHGAGTVWARALLYKLVALLAPTYQNNAAIDVFLLMLAVALLLLGGLYGRLEVHARGALMLGVVAILAVLAPSQLMGVWHSDLRLPCLLAVLVFSFTRVEASMWGTMLLIGLTIAGVGLRVSTTLVGWRSHDREVRELVEAGRGILPPGARLLPAGSVPPTHWHSSCWLLLDHDIFHPQLFHGAHMLSYQPGLFQMDGGPPSREQLLHVEGRTDGLRTWWRDFDVLLWMEDSPPPLPERMTELGRGSWFTFYAIDRGMPAPAR